jgi:predicted Zn-dependent protease
MRISGIYYNGISSVAKRCIVSIEENSIEIFDKESEKLIAVWFQENTSLKHISNSLITIAHDEEDIEALIEIKINSNQEYHEIHDKLHFLEKDIASKIYKQGTKAIVPIGIFCIGFIAFFYFVLIPPIGEYFAAITPIVMENKLGENISEGIQKDLKIDTIQSIKIQKYFDALEHKSDYKYTIKVVKDDEQINAFAIPGGHIYIYSGILNKIETYEQLNALLFHEMAHVEYRHTLKSIYRLLSRMMFISLITSDVNSLSAVILDHANTLYALSFSKQLETEADSYSIQKMKEQKNDLQGFVDLFKLIETESEHEVPSFLNTHPLTKERINNGDNALKTQPSYIKDPISEKLFYNLKGINPSTP